jgi:hypothetical protein
VLEKEKQPELNVAAASTIPRDKNFIIQASPGEGRALHAANLKAFTLDLNE